MRAPTRNSKTYQAKTRTAKLLSWAVLSWVALSWTALSWSGAAWAGAVLDGAGSGIQFVSVKNDAVAEVHDFPNLGGAIGEDGSVTVRIPLADVETNIPIRNERMREMLFEVASFPTATIGAKVDLAALRAMRPGDYAALGVSFELSLHGKVQTLRATVGVTRLGDGVRIATLKPVIVNAASFGLADGVERLREVVGLGSIATAVPVTAQLVFRFRD